jgi:anion transporter
VEFIRRHIEIKLILVQIIPVLVFIINPFNMNIKQSILFSSLLITIIWWVTNIVDRNIACIFMLLIFLIFSNSSLEQIFKFALSPIFFLIIMSFLLSKGISNSKITNRISLLILQKYGKTPIKIVMFSFIFGVLLIIIIPQPFARVILLSSIYKAYINNRTKNIETREVLIFSIFVSCTTTSMLFINGDIILNYSALQLGGIQMTLQDWMVAMFLPSVLVNIFIYFIFIFIFKDKLNANCFNNVKTNVSMVKNNEVSNKEISAIIIMIFVVFLWLTESWHRIDPAVSALFGVLAMFAVKILNYKDIKSINVSLMFFLISVFSIGTVLKQSGITTLIFSKISIFIPNNNSSIYLFSIILITMLLHMLVGSALTALSVVIPSLISLNSGIVNPVVIVLICYISVNIHYIFPIHHVTIMIGSANHDFNNKLVIKIGLIMTFITIILILCLYIPWWKIIGLL